MGDTASAEDANEGSFALLANGTTAYGLQNRTAVLDLALPVRVDAPHIFTRIPRDLVGSTFWPGIESSSPDDGGLWFETDVGGMLFVFMDAAISSNIPPYLTDNGTRWSQLDEPLEILDTSPKSTMQPVILTAWSRPVSPGYSEKLAAPPGFNFLMVAFKANTETEYVYTERDASATGGPASPLPGDATYFPAAASAGSCGGQSWSCRWAYPGGISSSVR